MRDFNVVVEAGARVKAGHLPNIFRRAKIVRDRLVEVCDVVKGELQQLKPGDDVSEGFKFYADQLVEIELAAYDLGDAVLLIEKVDVLGSRRRAPLCDGALFVLEAL